MRTTKTGHGLKHTIFCVGTLAAAMLISSAALADNWTTSTTGRITSGSGTNVGIGTTSLGSGIRLQINGNVRASGFVEATGGLRVKTWAMEVPDYVFGEQYTLKSLAEVEDFVKTHRHLPDVPSASELETNGMDVAEMNLVLLKKVEELTLHLIEQDKQIKALKATVSGKRR
jgi:hypothetical protein